MLVLLYEAVVYMRSEAYGRVPELAFFMSQLDSLWHVRFIPSIHQLSRVKAVQVKRKGRLVITVKGK